MESMTPHGTFSLESFILNFKKILGILKKFLFVIKKKVIIDLAPKCSALSPIN